MLFAAYSPNGRISVRFFLTIFTFFDIVSIRNLVHNCFSVQ